VTLTVVRFVKNFRIFCIKEQKGSQDFEHLQKIVKYALVFFNEDFLTHPPTT